MVKCFTLRGELEGEIMKIALSIIALSFSLLIAKDNTTYIKVNGMQCNYSCTGKVNSVIQNLEGVKESSVDFTKGIATVRYDDKKLKRDQIIDVLKKNTSYSIESVSTQGSESYSGCSAKTAKKTEI